MGIPNKRNEFLKNALSVKSKMFLDKLYRYLFSIRSNMNNLNGSTFIYEWKKKEPIEIDAYLIIFNWWNLVS